MPLLGKNQNVTRVGLILLVLILLCIPAFLFFLPPSSPPVSEESLIIASGTLDSSLLTLIAEENGYFQKYGLNVTLREYPAGTYAVKELLAGNADLACAAEFVGVANSFQDQDLKIITTTAKINNLYFIISNDRGITKPSDLKGKTIAVPKGTVAEFFLGRYLTLNGMDISDITILYLTPAEVIKSVVTGDADAAVIWEPYAYQIEQQLGRKSTRWQAQSGQLYYWVTYARSDMIRDKPEMIRKYLRALDDAETYVSSHQPEAKGILKRRQNLTDDSVNRTWRDYRFMLSLDQALIIEMEDEARWMAGLNMTGGRAPPSYLDMMYQDPMREVKPSAVTIIR
jgi:ABC-type nitrate/sulfonate/bicarbonate transport system substrate-binding protein